LLKLQAKKSGLGAAWGRRVVAVALVEGMATVVERLDRILAFVFVVVVLGKAILNGASTRVARWPGLNVIFGRHKAGFRGRKIKGAGKW
jgi:preprotein translocase subunit SecG